ncbi:MAG: maltodextrin glucosidase [Anaerolineaceae bacterium]|nr:maltodextrin glucosidase [Anaerolineaceae bacterium]
MRFMVNVLHWTAGLHHDGSAMYVSNPLPKQGETVTIRLRVPKDAPIRAVFLRTAPDGEQHLAAMHKESEAGICAYWSTDVQVSMPYIPYRFRIMSDEGAYWLTAMGVSRADAPDLWDYKLLADFAAPDWLDDAVFYQIFPDRFCNGDPTNDVPDGAWSRRGFTTQHREWGAPILSFQQAGTLDFYGGDLQGITQKLDYLQDLGVNALFLNPIFTAYTNHRYDVANYNEIDPHLGGNKALAELRQALDARGMRLILDVTPNHCGSENVWFLEALKDPNVPTAEYFTFNHYPDDYETWLGHKSLVKLNYRSQALRDVMYRGEDSVIRHWMHEPYRIDGWRLDVANMTARQGMVQLSHKVWREMRRSVKADNPQAYLFGENFYDGTPHLQGDELDAIMNYKGFTLPLWDWLHHEIPAQELRPQSDPVPLTTEAMAEQWQRFWAAVPWAITAQQFNLLDSHDTPRILNILGGDKARMKLAVALLMTIPGVPCIYYGDEIGMEGGRDPDNRRCMIWDEAQWDHDLRGYYQRLIHLRRTAPALRHGGFQMIYAEGDLLAYQRQSAEQRLIVVAQRGNDAPSNISLPVQHAGIADGVSLTDYLTGQVFTVEQGQLNLGELAAGRVLLLEG